MRILLIDDHAVLRAGLRQLLVSACGAVVMEAADGDAARVAIATARPDLVILDLGLAGKGGLALLPDLHAAGLKVLVLTMYTSQIYARRALQAGALGYASKNIAPDDLLDAVQQVASGRRYVERLIAEELVFSDMDHGGRLNVLSTRDVEIMRLLAAGRGMAEIAQLLDVSYKTIANTATNLRSKIGVTRTAELIRLAIEMEGGPITELQPAESLATRRRAGLSRPGAGSA